MPEPVQPPNSATEPTSESPPNEPPKTEDGKAKRQRNLNRGVPKGVGRGADGKLASKGARGAKRERRLSNRTQSILEAMRHVHNNGPESDLTYQQDHLRRWMLKNEGQFHDRLLELEREDAKQHAAVPTEAVSYDGTGPCPTCGHEPEVEDTSTTAIRSMIGRVLEHAERTKE